MPSWFLKALHALMRQRSRDRQPAPLPHAQADAPRELDLQLAQDLPDDTQPAAFNGLDGTEHDDGDKGQPRRRA